LSQVFEVGGKRAARVDLADTGIRAAESEQELTGRQIAARVSLAYWTAAAANALQSLLRQDIENFDQIIQYHRDRVREGAMAEVDLMRILLERDRLTVTLRAAEQESARAIIVLLREMGRNELTPVLLADAITGVRDLPLPRTEEVLASRPEVSAARRAVDQARAAVRVQQSLARPDPEVMGGYKRATGFDTVVASIGIDLPFRNRNQGAIGSAQASVRAAEAQLLAIENQIRAEVALAWTEYEARRRIVTEILGPMRQRADEVSRIVQASYREGAVDLLRLLDAERTRIDSLTTYFRALSDYQQSATTLQIVTGAPL
jgi:cobalt-zinc-cadmium efflux system outer membrane protein